MTSIEQEPQHIKVIKRIKKDIELGIFTKDKRLPTVFELAQILGVSRAVLREALQVLEKEKVIIRKHGVGTFVNAKPLFTSGIEQLSSVSTMIREAGMEPGTIFIDVSEEESTDESIALFDSDEDDRIVTIKRVRTADDEPVVYCVDNVLAKNLPVGAKDFPNTSIFEAIELSGKIRIEQAIAHIEPVGYDEVASSILRCGIEVPLLVLLQKHYSEDGEMVLYSKNYFRADKFSFHVVRKRV